MPRNLLNPALLIKAYSQGVFPMADSREGRVRWYSPDPRGFIPLDGFHLSRSLQRVVRSGRFDISTDRAFERVMSACAAPRPGHPETWISQPIIDVYCALQRLGLAHSVEAWREGRLVGGLYGVHLRGAFFGESMFSLPAEGGRDASKVCLVWLVAHLRRNGFRLLDTQFVTPHLARFGCTEISRQEYLVRLEKALAVDACWKWKDANPCPGPRKR